MTQTPVQQSAMQPQYTLTNADKKRQKRIADAWKAYNGELDKPLQKMPGQPDDNVLSNRMQAVVDRGVDFLFGKELEMSVEDGAPPDAQLFLNGIWGKKEKRVPLLQRLAMNGAMAGQAFLRIVPSDDTYRLVAINPATVFVRTSPHDCDTVLLYCIEYSTTQGLNGHDEEVYYHEEIQRIDPDDDGDDGDPFADTDATWQICHWTRIGDRGKWQMVGDPISWPYNFPPIFSCQNLPMPNDFWGKPDITSDLIAMNESLNLVQSNINRIEKMYGQPILYAVGTGESVIDIVPGKIIGLPLVESKIVSVPITSDVVTALDFAANLRSDIDEQSSVPGVATGRIADLPKGAISGIAIELLFMPLLKKTDKKRCLYGDMLIDVCVALLVLGKMDKHITINLAWQYPLPNDDLPAVQAALAKKELNISNATLQRELGYDPVEEAELSKSEDAQALVNFSKGQGMPPTPVAPNGGGLPMAIPGVAPLPGQPKPAPAPTGGQ